MQYEDATLDEVYCALQWLSPDKDRDDWAKVAMALKSEFGELAFDLFDSWSSPGQSYNTKACRDTWKSVKASGREGSVTIASIFKEAIDCGYTPEKLTLSASEKSARKVQAEERRALAQKQAEEEAVHTKRWHLIMKKVCADLWGRMVSSGESQYLLDKQVDALGVRFIASKLVLELNEAECSYAIHSSSVGIREFFDRKTDDTKFRYLKPGTFAVPVRDSAYNLRNLQLVHKTGVKKFLPGPKSGLFHFIDVASADHTAPIVIAEGYATAASCHMATGLRTVVAFDCGNLIKVSIKMREIFPESKIVIAGDDDSGTEGNPGAKKALEAANACNGVVVLPNFEVGEVQCAA
ncbi:MAG: putative DNA primase/helicase [Flavobacteriales bacterium]